MFRTVITTLKPTLGLVGEFPDEHAYRTGQAPARTFWVHVSDDVPPGVEPFTVLQQLAATLTDTNVPEALTLLAFQSLMTPQENIALNVMIETHPDVQARGTLQFLKDSWVAAKSINRADPRVVQGLNTLVGFGVLTIARRDAILAAPVRGMTIEQQLALGIL